MIDIIDKLSVDHKELSFKESENFRWSPGDKTIYYIKDELKTDNGNWRLLHELGHALLDHNRFAYDLELIRMELMAWDKAVNLSDKFAIELGNPADIIESCMNTYRDWVYSRSICPNCEQTGLQQATQYYKCPACQSAWRVPMQQGCAVRRTLIN